MKGLLQRLVARAAGTSVAVRSDARLSFGAVGPFHGGTTDVGAGPSLSFDSPPATLGVAIPPAPRAVALTDPVEGGAGEALFAPDVPRLMATQPLAPPVGVALPPLVLPSVVSEPPGAVDVRVVDAASFAAPVPASVPERVIQDRVIHDRVTQNRVRIVSEPPILVPFSNEERARGAAAIPMQGAPAMRGMQASAVRSDDEREVHIHIGCIEVRAVHESPAPRRRPTAAPTQAPMSLDAYLSKRGRG